MIQKHLLSEVDLTLKRAVEIAQAIEAAEHHTEQVKTEAAVRRVSPCTTVSCNHCGKNNHKATQCHFKNAICNNCQKKGHLVKIYRAPKQTMDTGVTKKKS